MLLVGVPARHRSVPRDSRRTAHRSGAAIRPSTQDALEHRLATLERGLLDPGAAAVNRTVTTSRSARAARVAESAPSMVPRAAQAWSAPSGAKPVCSLNSVRSIDRHWLSSTCSAVSSSSDLGPRDDRPDLALGSRAGAQRAGSGRVPRRVGVGVLDQAALGGFRHGGAQVSGHFWVHRLQRGRARELPQPATSNRVDSTTPRQARRAAVRSIEPPRRCCWDAPHSTTAVVRASGNSRLVGQREMSLLPTKRGCACGRRARAGQRPGASHPIAVADCSTPAP